MELIAASLDGGPVQVLTKDLPVLEGPHGVVGIDVASQTIDHHPWTVVQLLLDDDHPLFDRTLLDSPIVAEVRGHEGSGPTLALEPFDHHAFRQQLQHEREAGESQTRGMLVTTDGQLPPPYVRLAFLPLALAATAKDRLTIRRTTVAELVAGVEAAHQRGEIGDDDRRALLVSIEQRHPTPEG